MSLQEKLQEWKEGRTVVSEKKTAAGEVMSLVKNHDGNYCLLFAFQVGGSPFVSVDYVGTDTEDLAKAIMERL